MGLFEQPNRRRVIEIGRGVSHLRVRRHEAWPAGKRALGDLDGTAIPAGEAEITRARPFRNRVADSWGGVATAAGEAGHQKQAERQSTSEVAGHWRFFAGKR